jgi:4-carboxymuconolactone decarboxylase
MARLAMLPRDQLDEPRQALYDHILETRPMLGAEGGGIPGPFNAYLRSPAVGTHIDRLGRALHTEITFSARLRELAILLVAAEWKAQFEWFAHAPLAQREGVHPDVVNAIYEGRQPDFASSDEATIYRFVHELLATRRVSSQTYQQAIALLGETGLMELVALLGQYTLVSMTLNAFQVPLPGGATLPFPEPES